MNTKVKKKLKKMSYLVYIVLFFFYFFIGLKIPSGEIFFRHITHRLNFLMLLLFSQGEDNSIEYRYFLTFYMDCVY